MSDEATVTQPEVAEAVNTAGAAVGEAVAANGAENGDSEAPAPAETETAAANTEDAVTTKTKEGEQPVGMLQTTARGDPKNYSANVKSDPSLLPESDDPGEIRKQVEFYLSDSNLPTDRFLWTQTGGPENKPVKLKIICGFKRMQRFKNYETVVAALRDSRTVEISGAEGEEVIARKSPYKLNSYRNKVDAASVYVKGFGDEEPSTQFDLEAFFAKFGSVNSVRLRRSSDNMFKGSVFVEFQDEETAKAFLEVDPKPQWKGHDLKIVSKSDYQAEKNALLREGELELSSSAPRFFEGRQTKGHRGGGRGRGRGGRDSRGTDPDDWKKRREEDAKNGSSGWRGGRGRGRGRHDRNDRHDRGNRNQQREKGPRPNQDVKPVIHHTTDKETTSGDAQKDVAPGDNSPSKKRQRDEAGDASEQPAKKVDTKVEATAEAS